VRKFNLVNYGRLYCVAKEGKWLLHSNIFPSVYNYIIRRDIHTFNTCLGNQLIQLLSWYPNYFYSSWPFILPVQPPSNNYVAIVAAYKMNKCSKD